MLILYNNCTAAHLKIKAIRENNTSKIIDKAKHM